MLSFKLATHSKVTQLCGLFYLLLRFTRFMKVAIIDYQAGNILSVVYALERLGVSPVLTADAEQIQAADKVILPGDGHARTAMEQLQARQLDQLIPQLRQPVLGICIGLQLFCQHSAEGDTPCLGIFEAQVQRFDNQSNPALKVPHMGWNQLQNLSGHLTRGITEGAYVYFVHSYYATLCASTSGQANYLTPFSATMERDNFFATQFHPEKSGVVGEQILQNFLKL